MEGAHGRGREKLGTGHDDRAAMKLSELIARLAEMLEEHGDVDVCIFASEYGEEAISAVSLSSSDGQKRIVIE